MTTEPATIHFRMYPDATFSEVTTLLDSAGLPINLSARSARMQIRRDRDDAAALFTLTSAPAGGITLNALGQITISLASSLTYPVLTPPIDRDGELWFHDLLLTDPSASPPTVERLYQGTVLVFPGVTRPV